MWTSVFSNMVEIKAEIKPKMVSPDEKLASVQQADVLTNFKPIWPRQKICSSTTKSQLVCGSLNITVFINKGSIEWPILSWFDSIDPS